MPADFAGACRSRVSYATGSAIGQSLAPACSPQHMRESSEQYRGKPDTRRHHGQHHRAGKAVVIKRQRGEDEHHTVDGEAEGRDRTKHRGPARDDR